MIKIIKEINKRELKEFLYNIDLSDNNLYEELNEGRSLSVFQFTAPTAENLVTRIKPKNFNEMCAVSAMARPGTIEFADDYINSKDKNENKYPKLVQEVLKESYGICIYQEQILRIFNKIGGFTLFEADEVRALMKKLGKADKKKDDLDRWEIIVKKFEDGAILNGITKQEAELVANDLLKLSAYSFNLSHAVAYTYIAIINLYLSYYFKPYYFSAVLSYEANKEDTLKEKLNACKIQNFTILPPDINKSKLHFSPENNNIRFGLNEIKFVGETPATKIVEMQPFTSFFDFISKIQGERITKTTINALLSVGAFDELIGIERTKNLFVLEQFLERKKSIKIVEKLQALWQQIENEATRIPGLETNETNLANYEEKFLGFNFFYTLFTNKIIQAINAGYKKGLCGRTFSDITKFQSSTPIPVIIEKFRFFNDKNAHEMAFADCTDMAGKTISVPIFWNYWRNIKEKVMIKNVFLMSFYKDEEKDNILFGSKKFTNDEDKKRMLHNLTRR